MAQDNNENKMEDGYRFLMDAKNDRQYAIRFENGKPAKFTVSADTEDKKELEEGEKIFAFEDGYRVSIENGKGILHATAYQIQMPSEGQKSVVKSIDVKYNVHIETEVNNRGMMDYRIRFHISQASRAEIMVAGFDNNFPINFAKRISGEDPSLDLDEKGMAQFTAETLRKAFLAQHGTQTASMARREIADELNGVKDKAANKTPIRTKFFTAAQRRAFKYTDEQVEELLEKYASDLTKKAREGALDPVIGREKETDQAIKVLSRRKQASLCFTGDAGVGKTAMFSAIADYIEKDDGVPESLRGARVIELDIQGMLAGSKYRGQFEERIKPVIDGLKEREGYLNGRKVILAIDEIHSQLGAGSGTSGGGDAGNLMKPFLTSKGIAVMGTTTGEEYRQHIEKDGALASRFEQLVLDQPSDDATKAILQKLWPLYRDHHGIKEDIAEDDFEYIINMTNRYAPNAFHPRKGEKAMDMAAASAAKRGSQVVEREDIIAAVAQASKLSPEFLSKSDNERFLQMEKELPERILGQPNILRVVDGLVGSRSGLTDPNQPWGAFVLQGPTGTGKTQLCKELANYLFGSEDALIQLNMSEYSEKHTVSRLIGAPPGYVGFNDSEPALTERIRQRPYSILLLDEIEKAHPDVFNVLLPVLNDGKMKDNHGKTTMFNNVIVIMTTNLGAKEAMAVINGRGGMGIGAKAGQTDPKKIEEQLTATYDKARSNFFRPEMVNRIEELGGFVTFIPLTQEVINNLTVRELASVNKRLSDTTGAGLKGVSIEVTDEVKAEIAKNGYNPEMGARPLRKVVREKISNPLGKWLMAHKDEVMAFAAENGGAKIVINNLTEFKPEVVKPDAMPSPITEVANENKKRRTPVPPKKRAPGGQSL
jgi:ATP-dependent Clp protease ATP-binding subunit ClpC